MERRKTLQFFFSFLLVVLVLLLLYSFTSSGEENEASSNVEGTDTAKKQDRIKSEPVAKKDDIKRPSEIIIQQIIKQDKQEEPKKDPTTCETIDYGTFVGLLANKKDKTFLEIGPWANPLAGILNAKYFDRVDREAIVKAVLNEGVLMTNADSVPKKIDFVSETGDLSVVTEKFDHVFSRYNVEHQFDLVEHLNKVYDILNENGRYFAIIPDKRFMFDYYLSDTLLSDVLSAHYVKESKYSLRVWLQSCERTREMNMRPDWHWQGNHGEDVFELKTNFNCYESLIKDYLANKKRTSIEVNSHPWRFYPRSFLFIVDSLNKMGLTKLKVDKIYCTRTNELHFYAILKK